MNKVGVIGSGKVGQVLADGFLKIGYQVMRGSREPSKLGEWKSGAGENASVGTFSEAARFGDLVVLAVKGLAAEEALKTAGPENLASKTVIDTTNPIANSPPQKGVLSYFTEVNHSLMERLQKAAPKANFVKAFSSVGSALMVNPSLGARPTMFICGDSEKAKAETRQILDKFGWDTEDMGGVVAARAIEPLCMLWCIPGFLRNDWNFAFKLQRK
jgi:predicted dinucleotide-binding enzyme